MGLYSSSAYVYFNWKNNKAYSNEVSPQIFQRRGFLSRKQMISNLDTEFDVIIIGGGASGTGSLLSCSRRGLNTVLFESEDFAAATSSKSTKLLHGGIRYLERVFKFKNNNRSLDWKLVKEALGERNLLLNNVPYMTNQIALVIPATNMFMALYYYAGCYLYQFLSEKNKDTRYT